MVTSTIEIPAASEICWREQQEAEKNWDSHSYCCNTCHPKNLSGLSTKNRKGSGEATTIVVIPTAS
jgi:hypothetical protein